ncbi:hypothetical protein BN85414000 [Alteracholeplasma palmae J233]|uniref:Uncharacterized protein n=2 Tax=Acholeplasma palmae TaxID=38986 RepID=U4KLY1_ALTPJ|nr:hypothetical protein BN85414000 [Alteracholeplasma palmae J233]
MFLLVTVLGLLFTFITSISYSNNYNKEAGLIKNSNMLYNTTVKEIPNWNFQVTNTENKGTKDQKERVIRAQLNRSAAHIDADRNPFQTRGETGDGNLHTQNRMYKENTGDGAKVYAGANNKYSSVNSYVTIWQEIPVEKHEDYTIELYAQASYNTLGTANKVDIGAYASIGTTVNPHFSTDITIAEHERYSPVDKNVFKLTLDFNSGVRTKMAIAVRVYASTDEQRTFMNIKNLNAYLKADYDVQNELETLFTDYNMQAIKYRSLADFNTIYNSLEARLNNTAQPLSQSMRTLYTNKLALAKSQRDAITALDKRLDDLYVDQTETDIKTTVTEAMMTQLKSDIDSVASQEYKNELLLRYQKAREIKDSKLLKAKNDAIAILDAKALELSNKVDSITGLDASQKENYKSQIQAAWQRAKDQVNASLDSSEVETKKNEGLASLDSEYLVIVKDNMNKIIEKKATSLKDKIAGLKKLTDKEIEEYQAQIRITKEQAQNNIASLTNIEQIQTVGSEGLTKLENAFLIAAQINAKRELDSYIQGRIEYINQLPAVDKPRRDELIAELEKIRDDGKSAISLSNSEQEVFDLEVAAKEEMHAIEVTGSKENAINYLKELSKNSSTEPITNQMQAILDGHIASINSKDTYIDVEKQMHQATQEIELQIKKEETLKELDAYEKKMRDAIASLKNISEAEKDQKLSQYDAQVLAEKENIQQKTTQTDVEEALKTAEKALLDQAISANKIDAKLQVEKEVDLIEALINGLEGISDKTQYLDKLVEDKKDLIQAIESKNNLNNIDSTKNSGLDNIKAELLKAQKESATNLLNDKKTEILGKIETELNNQEQYNTYEELINKTINDAIDKINNASKVELINEIISGEIGKLNEELQNAKENGQEALAAQKERYIESLKNRKDSSAQTVTNLENLDKTTEIDPVIDSITNTFTTTESLINGADTLDKIREYYDSAVNDIQSQVTSARLLNEKKTVINQINEKYTNIKNQLENTKGLTTDQKETYQSRLDELKTTGETEVNKNDATMASVFAQKNTTLNSLDDLYKEFFYQGKINEITSLSQKGLDLLDKVKDHLPETTINPKRQEITDLMIDIENKIKSKSLEEADIETERLMKELNKIITDVTQQENDFMNDTKNTLKTALNEKIEKAIKEIQAYEFLTPGEKSQYIINHINKIGGEGNMRIDYARTKEEADAQSDEADKLLKAALLDAKRENAYGEIASYVRSILKDGHIGDDIAGMIAESFTEIKNLDKYEEIDGITSNTKNQAYEKINADIIAVREEVKAELENYARKPITPEAQVIIDEIVASVNEQNYNQEDIIHQIKESGKIGLDKQNQKELQAVKDKVRSELEKHAGSPMSDEKKALIDSKVEEITLDNYDQEDVTNGLIESGKTEINEQADKESKELQATKDAVRTELENYARKPITSEAQAIIDDLVDSINEQNYNKEDIINQMKESGKIGLDEQNQKELQAVKDKVRIELEKHAGSPMSDEKRAIIDSKIEEITLDNYDQEEVTNELIESGKVEISEQAESELKELKEAIRTELEKYAKKPISEELKKTIEDKVNSITLDNYQDEAFKDGLIQETKDQVDAYQNALVDAAKDKLRKELEALANKPITDKMQSIIDEYVDRINWDNYEDETLKESILEEGKQKVEEQNEVEASNAGNSIWVVVTLLGIIIIEVIAIVVIKRQKTKL